MRARPLPSLLWPTLQRVVGCCGVVGVVGCVVVFGRIVRGPGDDNPIAMVALWGALLSLVPAAGVVGRRSPLWLGASLPLVALVGTMLGVLLGLLR